MTRGREASLDSALLLVSAVVLAVAEPIDAATAAGTQNLATGNVGCLFNLKVCQEGEACFDDLVVGRCVPAGTDQDLPNSVGPLSGPALNLLAGELRRVFSQGFTWEDDYCQCVFQTLLDRVERNTFYSGDLCSHLLPAPAAAEAAAALAYDEPESVNDDPDDDDDVNLLLGARSDASNEEPLQDETDSLREFLLSSSEEPGRFNIGRENDLLSLLSNIQHQPDDSFYGSQADEGYSSDEDEDGQIFIAAPETEYLRSAGWRAAGPPGMETSSGGTYLDDDLPGEGSDNDETSLYEQVNDPYLPAPALDMFSSDFDQLILPAAAADRSLRRRQTDRLIDETPPLQQVDPEQLSQLLSDDDDDDTTIDTFPEILPVFVPFDDNLDVPATPPYRQVPEPDRRVEALLLQQPQQMTGQPAGLRMKRPSSREFVVFDDINEPAAETAAAADENISTYDFDYNDASASEEGDGDDTVYYSNEADDEDASDEDDDNNNSLVANFPVETIFDRRERLDVKKPGPFYANSQNNFFLDKLLALEGEEETGDGETEADYQDDLGQTEYEMPLTMKNKQKKSFQLTERSPVLGYETTPQENSYLVVKIKDRFKSMGQAMRVVDSVANQLRLPRQTFSQPNISTSRLSIPVQSNPRQLNASAMAKLLEEQLEVVKATIADETGVQVDSFSFGNEGSEVSSTAFVGHSRLFFALFFLTAGLASALVVGALLLFIRSRRGKKNPVEGGKRHQR